MKEFTKRELENIEQTVECSLSFKDVVLREVLNSNYTIVSSEEDSGNLSSMNLQWGYRCLLYSLSSILAIRLLHQENYFEIDEPVEVNSQVGDELEKMCFESGTAREGEDVRAKVQSDLLGIKKNIETYVELFDDPEREHDPEEVLLDLLRKPLGLVSHLNQNDLVDILKNHTRHAQLDYMKFFQDRAEREDKKNR
jgi:hypothetical protein